MSDYRAIAGVSISLRNLLRDRMEDLVDVTIAPPDVTITGITGGRLNLYLYQISENSYLKNQEILIHDSSSYYGNLMLSLDLFYLFTAHGSSETEVDSDLKSQYILSDAMQVLHDYPIISDKLEITRSSTGTLGDPLLDTSLMDEFEQVKIVFQPLTMEDISKIWAAFPETNFRRSVAYQVSVVQIKSKKPRRIAKPVGEPPSAGPRVHVDTLLDPSDPRDSRSPSR